MCHGKALSVMTKVLVYAHGCIYHLKSTISTLTNNYGMLLLEPRDIATQSRGASLCAMAQARMEPKQSKCIPLVDTYSNVYY